MSDVSSPLVVAEPALQRRGARAWGAFAGGALGLVLALILAIVALAMTVIGLLVACAALIARVAPKRRGRAHGGPPLLEGRRTADGWVAEGSSPSA